MDWRVLAVMVVGLVLLSQVQAQMEVLGKMGAAVSAGNRSAEVNVDANVNVSAHVPLKARILKRERVAGRAVEGGPSAGEMGPAMLPIEKIIKKHVGKERLERLREKGVKVEDIVKRIEESKRRAIRAVTISENERRRWVRTAEAYREIVSEIRETAKQFAEKKMRWARYRQMYLRGEIDENTYFNVSKDFVLSAIDVAIARLEAVKSRIADLNVPAADKIGEGIARLQELRAKVEAAQDLNELRTIYREEVLPAIREYHNKEFAKIYVLGTIRASQSVVARLDAAAARLTRYVELAKKRGIYDEEMEEQVNEILAQIETVKLELSELEQDVETGKVTSLREYMERLREIKKDVVEIYKDIAELLRETNKKAAEVVKGKRAEVREEARERARKQVTEQSKQEQNGSEVGEKEQNTGASVTVSTEASVSTGTEVEGEEQNGTVGAEVETEANVEVNA